jgi:hypothetical protein
MGSQQIQPETLEERVVYWGIISTWGLWLLGTLYFVGPFIGVVLLAIFAGRYLGLLENPTTRPLWIPIGVLVWIVGMSAMALALVIAHLDMELGIGQMIKSLFGWAKGWALFAAFPLAGAVLSIRPKLIYRAAGNLALQTLILVPFLWMAGAAGLPMDLYVSPLAAIGPGNEFFDVTLYSIDDTTGKLRWRFFSPWPTAAAFVASISLLFALFERSHFWKMIGIISALAICWMAGSRSSIIALPVVIGAMFVMSNLHRPQMLITIAFSTVAVILMLDFILLLIEDSQNAFNAARAASSRVRAVLNNIGYHRWYADAFWFGHGKVEAGPHLVQFMPIGSHHTWYGLLFVKGLVGFVALAVPIAWSIFELGLKSQCDQVARSALAITLAIGMFSFADNLEIVTYLIWPGLLVIGIGMRRPFRNPYAQRTRRPAGHQAIPHTPHGISPRAA